MQEIEYLSDLIRFPSVSRTSNVDVSDYVATQLQALGFEVERVDYDDDHGVRKSNVVGKLGSGAGGFAYFGHTDVVPADTWSIDAHGPFEPTVKEGRLYGRGSCDMKGSIASMLTAARQFANQKLAQPLYITCTADEEIGYGGAVQVVASSKLYREMVEGATRAVVGEPTTLDVVHAHKGSYGFVATARGEAAHSSTREGLNANLAMIPFLQVMKTIHDEVEVDPQWQNDDFDPPTMSWNIGVNDHTRATNIKPAQSICTVYFRPMPGVDADAVLSRARDAAQEHQLEFHEAVKYPAFHVDPTSEYVQETIRIAGRENSKTVCYGTDGAVLDELKEMVVLGPGSIDQAHKDDEWVSLDQLQRATDLFSQLIQRWCR